MEETMKDRLRQIFVIVFAALEILASVWVGSRLDQDINPDAARPYFLPANFTFAVWGVIFLGAILYAVYQALPAQKERHIHRHIGWWAVLNMALCSLWLYFSVQSGTPGSVNFQPIFILITVFIIIAMTGAMARTFVILRQMHDDLTQYDKWFVQIPMMVYFAWLNIAVIANTTSYLYAINWGTDYGLQWANAILIIAIGLASTIILVTRAGVGTLAFTSVVVWAFIGLYANNAERATSFALLAIIGAGIVIVITAYHFLKRATLALRREAAIIR
jgi:translocator protein